MSICGKEMENSYQKSFDRVVSQRALQMGSSFPCQICVVGFLSGVCLTTLFLAALTSFGTFEFGGISFSTFSTGISAWNSSSEIINMVSNGDCNLKAKETERIMYSQESVDHEIDERVSSLYSAWSALLNKPISGEGKLRQGFGLSRSNEPKAPHLENCKWSAQVNKHLDSRVENESYPPWTLWKGFLDTHPVSTSDEQLKYYRRQAISEGAYPPWITGSDEENYPYTRKVQRDIWVHQHPLNCSDPNVRFLVADWERLPGFGIGAQIAGMCGLLAIAINEKRVLVTNYYNRADHDGCRGPSRSSWSCYFFPETSQECRDRAFQLMGEKEAWEKGILFSSSSSSSREQSNGNRAFLYLNVYDLTPINNYLYWFGLGIFHSGIEVHGLEYGFGAHEYPTSGVFEVEPKSCPGFTFRRSVLLGSTDMSQSELRSFMEHLSGKYHGDTYHLIAKNCNHFSDEACMRLTGKPIPGWVNRLARLGSFCNCLLPENIQVTAVRHLPDHPSYSDDGSDSAVSSITAESVEEELDHHLLTTPNGDVAYLKEKPVRLAKELL